MTQPPLDAPFRSYGAYLKSRFKERVQRVPLDAGFGCPHRDGGRGSGGCDYCNARGSGTGSFDLGLSIPEQMARGIDGLSKRGIGKYIAYFQAFCGTGASLPTLKKTYEEAIAFPGVVGLIVGTRPDMVPDPVLRLLSDTAENAGLEETWVELGLQSAHDRTLKRIHRGHDAAAFDDAVVRAHQTDLLVGAHVILGLPGEAKAEMMATADHLAGLPVAGVKLHQLYVESGTELARSHARGAFGTLSKEEYLDLAVAFIRRLPEEVILLRLAGKARKETLVAPRWAVDAASWHQIITREMLQRGYRQGDLCRRGAGRD